MGCTASSTANKHGASGGEESHAAAAAAGAAAHDAHKAHAAATPAEVPHEVIERLEAAFATLHDSHECHSLLKKYLTREVLDTLKTRRTAMGATLLDVIQSGAANLDSSCGAYAPDAESYAVFAPLFDHIIHDYHQGFKPSDTQPAKDFGNMDDFVDLDPEGRYVVSTRVRCGRSIDGYPFNPLMTAEQYKEIETLAKEQLAQLDGELKGTYYPLEGMSPEVQAQLIADHFLFKQGDRFLQAAHACEHWPTGRGIFHNDSKTFLVWVNEEDHLRIISMQKGGNLREVFARLTNAIASVEDKVTFARSERLGFLTFCPTNLGTTIRASVHIRLPHLGADRSKLEHVAKRYNLQVRGTAGEHTDSEGGVYDISNKRRLGLTEHEAVLEMQRGILELIRLEKEHEEAAAAPAATAAAAEEEAKPDDDEGAAAAEEAAAKADEEGAAAAEEAAKADEEGAAAAEAAKPDEEAAAKRDEEAKADDEEAK